MVGKRAQPHGRRKAITESQKGKTVVLVYPLDKWILMLLAAGAEVRNLGDVKWRAIEDGQPGKGTGRHIACFILRGQKANANSQTDRNHSQTGPATEGDQTP
jgi:hypothetical protein